MQRLHECITFDVLSYFTEVQLVAKVKTMEKNFYVLENLKKIREIFVIHTFHKSVNLKDGEDENCIATFVNKTKKYDILLNQSFHTAKMYFSF